MFGFKKKSGNDELGQYVLNHLSGLDIPENMTCSLTLYNEKLKIVAGAKEYNLNIEKLCSIDYQMDINIQKYTESNKALGLVGAAMFGVTGAVVGSAPKAKDKRLVMGHVILGYQSVSGEISYIILQDTEANSLVGAKFVDKIRPLIKNTVPKQSIEL